MRGLKAKKGQISSWKVKEWFKHETSEENQINLMRAGICLNLPKHAKNDPILKQYIHEAISHDTEIEMNKFFEKMSTFELLYQSGELNFEESLKIALEGLNNKLLVPISTQQAKDLYQTYKQLNSLTEKRELSPFEMQKILQDEYKAFLKLENDEVIEAYAKKVWKVGVWANFPEQYMISKRFGVPICIIEEGHVEEVVEAAKKGTIEEVPLHKAHILGPEYAKAGVPTIFLVHENRNHFNLVHD